MTRTGPKFYKKFDSDHINQARTRKFRYEGHPGSKDRLAIKKYIQNKNKI